MSSSLSSPSSVTTTMQSTSTPPPTTRTTTTSNSKLVVGTRIHLGKSASSSNRINQDEIDCKIFHFIKFCKESCHVHHAVIAIDVTPPPPKTSASQSKSTTATSDVDDDASSSCSDLYNAVQIAWNQYKKIANNNNDSNNNHNDPLFELHLLGVQPWGKFVPALNAIICWTCQQQQQNFDQILFVSMETSASQIAIQQLYNHIKNDNTILVVGAYLPGHIYCPTTTRKNPIDDDHSESSNTGTNNNKKEYTITELNGRTSPWNTLAIWNVKKLALTGFQLISEGHIKLDNGDNNNSDSYAGIEEVVTIMVLQKLLGTENAKAKLCKLDDVQWEQDFSNDTSRQQYHEMKMKSKHERAQKQMTLLFGTSSTSAENNHQNGIVYHC